MNHLLEFTVTLFALGSLAACSESGDGDAAPPVTLIAPNDATGTATGTGGGGAIGTFLGTLGGNPGTTAPPTGQSGTIEPGGPTTGGGDVAAVAGLYDFTFDNGGTRDVTYIEIRADGVLREYDFLGDENATVNGEFENCYDLVEGVIEPLGMGQYLVNLVSTTVDDGNGFIADIAPTEGGIRLVVTGVGGTVDMIAPLVTGLSTTDFNLCT